MLKILLLVALVCVPGCHSMALTSKCTIEDKSPYNEPTYKLEIGTEYRF